MTKPGTLLLIGSLALNVAFGVIAWRAPGPSTATPTPPVTPAPAAITTRPAAAKATASAAVPAGAWRAPLWADLPAVGSDSSIAEAIARLRRAGCPPREIVAAVRAMIDEIIREKRNSRPTAETPPYWNPHQRTGAARPPGDFLEGFQEADRLTRAYLMTPELFPADEARVADMRMRFGNLDVEKIRQLALLDMDEGAQFIRTMQGGSTTPGESRAISSNPKDNEERALRKAAAVAAILSPEEFAEYELRNSPLAGRLRLQLESFKPTFEEYKALFALEKARRNSTFDNENVAPAQRAALQEQQIAAARTVLSPERAADYEAVQKYGSNQLSRLMARLDLPLATVSYLNSMQDQTNVRARTIKADTGLTPEQKAVQLNALAHEAESQLGTTLGSQRALDAYKDIRGDWLRNVRNLNPAGR